MNDVMVLYGQIQKLSVTDFPLYWFWGIFASSSLSILGAIHHRVSFLNETDLKDNFFVSREWTKFFF